MSLLTIIHNTMKQQKPKPADVFHVFYQEHAENIYKFVYYKVDSREIAEDITSEAFLKTWRYIESNTVENVRAFVYRVANNLVIDHWRKKDREPTPLPEGDDDQDIPSTNDDPIRLLDASINSKIIAHALEEIHPNYKEVLVLRYINELSPEETAAILGKTPNNINVLTFRALKAIKKHVDSFYGNNQ